MISYFTSLSEAAQASFPPDFCRILAIREHGDAGFALFDTRPSGNPYLYEVHYDGRHGRWSEGSSSNGPGWHRLDPDSDVGVLTFWGEAPRGSDAVRIEFQDVVHEEPVTNGVYLALWWGIPDPTTLPRTTAFRVNAEWVPVHRRELWGL